MIRPLIRQLKAKYPAALVGDSARFSAAQKALMESYLNEKAFLQQDPLYLDFLWEIGGFSHYEERTEEDFTFYGFDTNVAMAYVGDELYDFEAHEDYMAIGHYFAPQQTISHSFLLRKVPPLDQRFYYSTNDREVREICQGFDVFLQLVLEKGFNGFLKNT